MPLIDEQRRIDPQLRAVVGLNVELIVPGVEHDLFAGHHAEVIAPDAPAAAAGRPLAPVEVNGRGVDVPHPGRLAVEVVVAAVEILDSPLIRGEGGPVIELEAVAVPGDVGGYAAGRTIVVFVVADNDVVGSAVAGGRQIYRAESEGKTGAVVIRFFEESADLLRRWLKVMPRESGFVFVSLRTRKRLRADALHLGLLRICEFAGARPFRFHAIRKRVVTDIIAATGDAKIGQLLAGHASVRTTQEYYNDVAEVAVDSAAASLADRLRGGGDSPDLPGLFFSGITT